jgi:hypothetical protein
MGIPTSQFLAPPLVSSSVYFLKQQIYQHQKSSFSKIDASKKGTVHKRYRRPTIDLRFSP